MSKHNSWFLFALLILVANAFAATYYVDPNGNDGADGLSWENAFATIAKALDICGDGVEGDPCIVDVNSGLYVTGPLIVDSNYLTILFRDNVELRARSRFDPNDSNNPDDPNSFWYWTACLFKIHNKSKVTFEGNNTLFLMNKEEYSVPVYFNAKTCVDVNSNTITISNHGLSIGEPVQYMYSGSAIGGLVLYQKYYTIVVNSDLIKMASNYTNAVAGIAINLTSEPSTDQTHRFSPSQYRHVLDIKSSKNIKIQGFTLKESGGDGIYVGKISTSAANSENIEVIDVICDDNYRTGMAIPSVKGLSIKNCVFRGTDPTLMGAGSGLHFETNGQNDVLTDIKVENILCEDNGNQGVIISLIHSTVDQNNISISFDGCYIKNSTNGFWLTGLYDTGPDGLIDVNNLVVIGCEKPLRIQKSSQRAEITFNNAVIHDCSVNSTIIPVSVEPHYNISNPGGVSFSNFQIYDNQNRSAICFAGDSSDTLYDITGQIDISNKYRKSDFNDWNGAGTNNVTVSCQSGANFGKVLNRDSWKWFDTIQSAVNDSNDFDTIEVSKGTFYEMVDYSGKSIEIKSTDTNDWSVVYNTIIDVNGDPCGVVFASGEDQNSIINGLTITNSANRAVYTRNYSMPVIKNCIIEDNNNYAVYYAYSSAKILNNIIRNNGYGILAMCYSDTEIKNNLILNNGSTGIRLYYWNDADVTNNTIIGQNWFGISWYNPDANIAPSINNCIIWDNTDDLYNCNATFSCIEDGDNGTGNIHSDPCFLKPIAYWRLDEGSGTTATDSISSLNGTITNAVWADGYIGKALSFDGDGDYVAIPNDDSLQYEANESFSICLWFNASAGEMDYGAGGWLYDSSYWGKGCFIRVGNGGGINFFIKDQLGTDSQIWSKYKLNDNQWYFIAAIRDVSDGKLYLYIDGKFNNEGWDATTSSLSHQQPITIGKYDDNYSNSYFAGLIDEVMVFDRALSANEIENLYYSQSIKESNYHLSPSSLCIDAGDPNVTYTGQTDIDGDDRVINDIVDIGADEYSN